MEPLTIKFKRIIEEMIKNAPNQHSVITEENVYQEGVPKNKPLMQKIINELMLPESTLKGIENLIELYKLSQSGKKCLILMEHYSNFDLPCFYELLERNKEWGKKIGHSIVSVAGTKLNEESPVVRAFAEIFTRVVIFPKTNLKNFKNKEEYEQAMERRKKINLAALKKLFELRTHGRIILVFPTGTRYRPWDPSTGKGLKEIDSYIKSYDYMVLIAINGNTLRLNPNGKMDEDIPHRDVMIYTVSKVYKCSEYRNNVLKTNPNAKDKKQLIVDSVMEELKKLHDTTEKERQKILEELGEREN